MRCHHYSVGREAVYQNTRQLLVECLKFHDYGRRCSAPALVALLLQASMRLVSLYQSCSMCAGTCCYETARKALCSNLPELLQLEARLNRALATRLPKALKRRPQRMAVDLVLTPYHGLPQQDPREIYRGSYKSGTSHFHAYATLYVVRRGQRFTVAITSVKAGDRLDEVVRRLLRSGARIGLKFRLILLDRAFWTAHVVSYLQRARCPFLMPVTARGRSPQHVKGPSGTYVFYGWKKSGFGSYVLHSRRGEKSARVSICVHRLKRPSGERKTLVYAYWGLRLASTTWVRETYRLRYGIESSYRQMHQSQARTTSRSPKVRLLRVGLSLILRNVWVWMHYELLSTPRRGVRQLNERRLHYQKFLAWLLSAIGDQMHLVDQLTIERPQPQTLALHTVPS
jgi:putative transposase